jgi:hypothetical protein
MNPKTLVVLSLVVGFTSPAYANCNTRPNIFGGYDTVCDSKLVQTTKPNIFGGYNTFDRTGHQINRSKPNELGTIDSQSPPQVIENLRPNPARSGGYRPTHTFLSEHNSEADHRAVDQRIYNLMGRPFIGNPGDISKYFNPKD